MQETAGFDKADYPLHSAGLAEWEGFLFLNLAQAPEPFEQAFAPLIDKFPAWQMPSLRRAGQVVYDVQANWKMIIQNYSECYHCPLIHPALTQLSPPTSGRNDMHEGAFLGGYMTLNEAVGSMTMSGHTARPPVGDVAGDDLYRIYYYSLFPNMLLSLHPDYVMAHTLWPQSAGRTKIVCEWYFDPAQIEPAWLRPKRRGRVLGHDQPPGLARLRALAARHKLDRLHARPLRRRRGAAARVRPILPQRYA